MEDSSQKYGDHLYVQVLGGFSITWQGRQIAGGAKGRNSQMVYLLQLLLHNRQKGVSRSQLEEMLFGDREINDAHHALRSVIYNTKRKLKDAGLPDVNFIKKKKGVFYWTDKIPVKEDAEEFEELLRQAQAADRPEQKLELLMSAAWCYQGDFLFRQVDMVWVTQEARRYQSLFFACVEEAALLLQVCGDWERMKELGMHASKVSPFADWEVITMEALVMTGQMNAARKLYDDTADLYLREQGIRPSGKLLEKMGTQVHRRYAVLDTVQSELEEGSEAREGGYLCPYLVFQGIYQMVERIMERGGQSVYLMLCTLVDSKGNPMESGTLLEGLSRRMEEAICSSVRRADAVTRYGKGQYLVLLLNATRENCRIVQRRINCRFLIGRQRTGIQYYVNSVLCFPDETLKQEKISKTGL